MGPVYTKVKKKNTEIGPFYTRLRKINKYRSDF